MRILTVFVLLSLSISAHAGTWCPQWLANLGGTTKEWLFNRPLIGSLKGLLRLRYNVQVDGLDAIDGKGGGILFMPNHPGYTDPAIQFTNLYSRFHAKPVAFEGEVNRKGIFGTLVRAASPLSVPDPKENADAEAQVEQLAQSIAAALKRGENILMYPEGQLSRGLPDLQGKSLVDRVLKIYPDARLVLSQMNGHLGSSLGAAKTGDFPDFASVVPKRLVDLARSGVFFMPKRPITVKYQEVTGTFPKTGSRQEQSDFLEKFYRDGLKAPTYVPYRRSEPKQHVETPYPAMPKTSVSGSVADVSPEVRARVEALIKDVAKVDSLHENDELSANLGMDSLSHQELNLAIEREFKVRNNAPIKTVAEAMLIASGKQATTGSKVRPPDGRWVRDVGTGERLTFPSEAKTLVDAFLHQLAKNPDKVIVTDEISGPLTYRDLSIAMNLFIPRIKKMEGKNIGVMLPGSVGEVIAFYSILFAGKTPVMVNFTAGEAKVRDALDDVNCTSVITSKTFTDRLRDVKDIQFPSIEDRFVTFEQLRDGISTGEKLKAMLRSEVGNPARTLSAPKIDKNSPSVILFTSGSKSKAKAVPYTHGMDIANINDVASVLAITDQDRLMSIAPPFHSLGHRLLTTAISLGVPQVFHGDPTDGATIGKISEYYNPSLIVGTPTFLKGIAWASEPGQLHSYRAAVMGAEKLTDDVVQALEKAAPRMIQLEGYGMTELAPVVFINPLEAPRRGTLGKPMPGLDVMIVDPTTVAAGMAGDHLQALGPGNTGMLLVAPKDPENSSVMEGYLNYEGTQPFVMVKGRKWFITGDLVERQDGEYYKFGSRLERSIKMGGEMVPMDGLEETLLKHPTFQGEADKGPVLAIENTPVESNPELVLFTTKKGMTPETVNNLLREGGWSKTFKVSRIIEVDEIPMLGTGKMDRKPLRERLK